jgi:hypothetical protein
MPIPRSALALIETVMSLYLLASIFRDINIDSGILLEFASSNETFLGSNTSTVEAITPTCIFLGNSPLGCTILTSYMPSSFENEV